MRLLIVEDNFGITLALSQALSPHNTIDCVDNGTLALIKARANTYSAILLDLNLPDMPGLDVCKEMRAAHVNAPILILTAEARTSTKVELLDAGADDYLTKPFSLEELKARLRALTRHHAEIAPSINRLVVGDLTLDKSKHIVERSGKRIELRRKEFALLECLMSHAGTVVTRALLTSYAWDDDDDTWTNTVDVHIKYLRDKIDRPFGQRLIKTVHGLGYKLEIPTPVANLRV
jgi:two-component system OmpR family response regulator